jgi:hypothetical protein
MFHRVVSQKLTGVSQVFTASILRAMIASETWINFYETNGAISQKNNFRKQASRTAVSILASPVISTLASSGRNLLHFRIQKFSSAKTAMA